MNAANTKVKKSNKRLSVERIYQKKTQLEHILLRPDAYIGSVEPTKQQMWVWDDERKCMVNREITFVPGLYKIFDEILGMLKYLFQAITGLLGQGVYFVIWNINFSADIISN